MGGHNLSWGFRGFMEFRVHVLLSRQTADNASDEEPMEEQAQDSSKGMEPGQAMEVEIMLLKFEQSVSNHCESFISCVHGIIS